MDTLSPTTRQLRRPGAPARCGPGLQQVLCAALGMGTGGAQPIPGGEYCSVQHDQPEAHVVGVPPQPAAAKRGAGGAERAAAGEHAGEHAAVSAAAAAAAAPRAASDWGGKKKCASAGNRSRFHENS